jgi:hypothetical protein
LGHPTDNRSEAADAELEKQLQETLTQQAQVDAENRGLQQLLTTANTGPDPEKLGLDISRLRTELADEKRKHAGLAEQLAASKSTLEEQDKLLGITAVREHIEESATNLAVLEREDTKVRDETSALEQKISGVEAKIVKLHSRDGQTWLIPDRSQTAKEPILAIVSGNGVEMDRFNHPEQSQQFNKSGARSGFETYLKHSNAKEQYVVFLIRPSGIALFKDLEKTARKKGFEVGFDALEENREIHFSAPPPIDDKELPGQVSGRASSGATGATGTTGTTRSGGVPGGTETSGESGTSRDAGSPTDSAYGTNTTGGTNESGSTNITGGNGMAGGTNVMGGGTNAGSGTNLISSTNTISGTNTGSPSGSSPPPPPKPKSWWQRFLEWIGIG